MRIDEVDLFAVVLLPMNESYKQAARIGAVHVLQDASVKVVLDKMSVPHRILGIVQQARVAASAWRSCLLDFFVGRIREAQHQVFVLLDELIRFRKQLQRGLLDWNGRLE